MGEGELRDVAARLHSTAIRLLRTLRREDDGSGLSAPRLSALSVIVYAGPLSLAALAEAEQVKPPTMSRIVEALVARGLVTREAKPGDRRSVGSPRPRKASAARRRPRAPGPRPGRAASASSPIPSAARSPAASRSWSGSRADRSCCSAA